MLLLSVVTNGRFFRS